MQKRIFVKTVIYFRPIKAKYDVKALAKNGDFCLEAVFDMYENICIATY
jgi:hypothetical protein